MKEYVILVDDADRPIGLMEKMEAHEKGLLHRAFSVFVFNSRKRYSFSNGLFPNIIHRDFGQIPVVVIPEKERPIYKQVNVGFGKKWAYEFP